MTTDRLERMTDDEVTRILTYAGYVLLSFELVKGMIVEPIKLFYNNLFYNNSTFEGETFKSYANDVLTRHKNEFEACLLYLKDFMDAIDSKDIETIQALRRHRNELAHNLPDKLSLDQISDNSRLLDNSKKVIFKLSNYRAYMEIGQEPELEGIDWSSVRGHEYLLLETIISKVKTLK